MRRVQSGEAQRLAGRVEREQGWPFVDVDGRHQGAQESAAKCRWLATGGFSGRWSAAETKRSDRCGSGCAIAARDRLTCDLGCITRCIPWQTNEVCAAPHFWIRSEASFIWLRRPTRDAVLLLQDFLQQLVDMFAPGCRSALPKPDGSGSFDRFSRSLDASLLKPRRRPPAVRTATQWHRGPSECWRSRSFAPSLPASSVLVLHSQPR